MTALGLCLRGVRKSYPGFELGPLSLDVPQGTVVGLLGPNGAGKTTLLNVIALQSRSTAGTMTYGGVAIQWGDAWWKSRLTYVRETPAFYDELTIHDTLRFAARIYEEWDTSFADALVTRFGLDPSRRVGTLSKGTRVKLALVAALAHHARLLLLDEPTAGLDPDAREDLQRALHDLLRERPDVGILLSSHIFEDLEAVADRVGIIRNGRLVLDCRRDELPDGATLAAIYRGSRNL
jgi:ABC-2 type transport system ATP-binding protein